MILLKLFIFLNNVLIVLDNVLWIFREIGAHFFKESFVFSYLLVNFFFNLLAVLRSLQKQILLTDLEDSLFFEGYVSLTSFEVFVRNCPEVDEKPKKCFVCIFDMNRRLVLLHLDLMEWI
jgi:hypothetical protein